MITGGGSWMSLWAARRLMEDGWQVELFDIDADAMGKVMAELGKSNQANAQELDVTVIDDVRAAVAGIIERHGSLDALINVAGITNWAAGGRKDFLDTTPDEWDRLLAGNFKGMLNCCHSVIPQMRKQKSGSIVSMAASRGLRGGPGAAIYSTAKAAIILFTQMVSTELGPYGIRVNSILRHSRQFHCAGEHGFALEGGAPGTEFGAGLALRPADLPRGRRQCDRLLGFGSRQPHYRQLHGRLGRNHASLDLAPVVARGQKPHRRRR
jgi:NAD(P)-dependent dehydrogenase (short-subunit alcohol dehydrogenase family)